MDHDIRCKRIIGGKTYNTETSTLLYQNEPDDGPHEESLFKSRHGAYFLYADLTNFATVVIKPLDPHEAQQWLERNDAPASLIEAEFGEMPEAGDSEARLTVRIPESLRQRIAKLADARGQSLNAWIQRCLERCADGAP